MSLSFKISFLGRVVRAGLFMNMGEGDLHAKKGNCNQHFAQGGPRSARHPAHCGLEAPLTTSMAAWTTVLPGRHTVRKQEDDDHDQDPLAKDMLMVPQKGVGKKVTKSEKKVTKK